MSSALSLLRARQRRQRRERAWAVEQERQQGNEQLAEDWKPLLERCLGRLDDCDRQVLIAYYFEGETLGRIGKRVGITAPAVKKRLDKAKGQLRGQLRRQGLRSLKGLLLAWLVPTPVLLGWQLRPGGSLRQLRWRLADHWRLAGEVVPLLQPAWARIT